MHEDDTSASRDCAVAAGRLTTCFQAIEKERMQGLPFLNRALEVEVVGTQMLQGQWLAVLITPWFMNLVLWPQHFAPEQAALQAGVGTIERVALPAGQFEFIRAFEPGFGAYAACSLFSPVLEFADHDTARKTAEAALAAVLAVDAQDRDDDPHMGLIWRGDHVAIEAAVEEKEAADRRVHERTRARHDAEALSRRSLLVGKRTGSPS